MTRAIEPPRLLRTDFRTTPIDIDAAPLLTWEPDGAQERAEIELRRDHGGTRLVRTLVSADAGWELPLPAESSARYRWRVRTARADSWSGWSDWAEFETGLLAEADWRGAAWIGAAAPGPSPVLRAGFRAVTPDVPLRGLRLAVCGLGIVDVRINGAAVADAVLDPPPTAYDAIVPYRVHDVSALVREGENTLVARLGRGFYAMSSPTAFGWHDAPWRDEPKLRAVLFDVDAPARPLLVTGDDWESTTTPAIDDSFYTGEVIDFTVPVIRTTAVEAATPRGTLRAARRPPVTRRERIEVVAHSFTGATRQRFDLAANVAGMLTITTGATDAPTLTIALGEHLGAGGEVVAADPAVPGGLQRSTIVAAPPGVTVPLDLTYAGMRHVEVAGTGAPVSIAVDRVSSAPESVGSFASSDGLLDEIHLLTRRTVENCLQGTPVDTPLYEKQAYTGDTQLLTETYAYNYWMPTLLGSWLEHCVLPSQHADGSLPGIAPSPPGDWVFDTPSPAWDAALFEVPRTLIRHYGDRGTLRRALPVLRRYLGFLAARFPDGIVDVGLGDWNPPGHIMPPEHPAIVSTAYHHRFLTLMTGFLRRLGADGDAAVYAQRAAALRRAFNDAFWQEGGWYQSAGDAGFRQTDNLLALSFGLVPSARRPVVLSRLERDIRERDAHLDTGMVGTRQLLRVLARLRPGLAFDVARAPGYPGWSHWIENGATTLYENWELDGRSHNHAMFGTIDEWLYADVAGVSPGGDGWSSVEIAPRLPGDGVFSCRMRLETVSGPIEAEWEDRGRSIHGRVTAPGRLPVVLAPDAPLAETARRSRPRGRLVEHVIDLEARRG